MNLELNKLLINFGFTQSKHDYFMFTMKDGDHFTIIADVDDLLVTGSYLPTIQFVKKTLGSAFTIKDLGELKYFLGIEVSRNDAACIDLRNQNICVLDMLKDTKMEFCNVSAFPFLKLYRLTFMTEKD